MINGDSSEEGHPVALASLKDGSVSSGSSCNVGHPVALASVKHGSISGGNCTFDDTQYQSRYLDIVPLVMELQSVLFPLAVVVPLLQEDILILFCYS
jgi:hypothetical protein